MPLNEDAIEVIRRQMGKHPTRVFSYKGRPVFQTCTKAWHKAMKRAGIKDFRFHDLRHTWASWHVQSGTSLYALQELGGWRSAEMVRRYAHFGSGGHLLAAARAIDSRRTAGTKLATLRTASGTKVENSGANDLITMDNLVAREALTLIDYDFLSNGILFFLKFELPPK